MSTERHVVVTELGFDRPEWVTLERVRVPIVDGCCPDAYRVASVYVECPRHGAGPTRPLNVPDLDESA